MCFTTERIHQSRSASVAAFITSSVSLTHVRQSPNYSLSAAVPGRWEKLHSIGVELKTHHCQRRLELKPQAASLSSTLLLYWWLLVSVVFPGTTSLGQAAAGGRRRKTLHHRNAVLLSPRKAVLRGARFRDAFSAMPFLP